MRDDCTEKGKNEEKESCPGRGTLEIRLQVPCVPNPKPKLLPIRQNSLQNIISRIWYTDCITHGLLD